MEKRLSSLVVIDSTYELSTTAYAVYFTNNYYGYVDFDTQPSEELAINYAVPD